MVFLNVNPLLDPQLEWLRFWPPSVRTWGEWSSPGIQTTTLDTGSRGCTGRGWCQGSGAGIPSLSRSWWLEKKAADTETWCENTHFQQNGKFWMHFHKVGGGTWSLKRSHLFNLHTRFHERKVYLICWTSPDTSLQVLIVSDVTSWILFHNGLELGFSEVLGLPLSSPPLLLCQHSFLKRQVTPGDLREAHTCSFYRLTYHNNIINILRLITVLLNAVHQIWKLKFQRYEMEKKMSSLLRKTSKTLTAAPQQFVRLASNSVQLP